MADRPIQYQPGNYNSGPPGGYSSGFGQARNAPAGLNGLRNASRLKIIQKCTCCGCWTQNSKYKVKDDSGNEIFSIDEDTDCCMRFMCAWFRSFEITIKDPQEREVMHFRRPIRCGQCYICLGSFCLPCLLQEMEVCSPPSDVMGTIRQNFSPLSPSFTSLDISGREMFHVTGEFFRPCCFSDLDFQVLSADRHRQMGVIRKSWTNCMNEMCTNAHEFTVTFPQELDVKDKAMVLGAAILIDYLHFT